MVFMLNVVKLSVVAPRLQLTFVVIVLAEAHSCLHKA
jgi:hypothetical protein